MVFMSRILSLKRLPLRLCDVSGISPCLPEILGIGPNPRNHNRFKSSSLREHVAAMSHPVGAAGGRFGVGGRRIGA
jgi:hypothetical protein